MTRLSLWGPEHHRKTPMRRTSRKEEDARDTLLRYRGSRGVAEIHIPAQRKRALGTVAAAAKPYVCGGASAVFASVCVHPFDLLKVRLQVFQQGSKQSFGQPSTLRRAAAVVGEGGAAGFFRGLFRGEAV